VICVFPFKLLTILNRIIRLESNQQFRSRGV
jgi:hypothetical protein